MSYKFNICLDLIGIYVCVCVSVCTCYFVLSLDIKSVCLWMIQGLPKGQKNLPPRLQKACSSPQTSQSSSVKPPTPTQGGPPGPGPRQGWPPYDGRWSNVPSQFMDARAGGRSQMEMSRLIIDVIANSLKFMS